MADGVVGGWVMEFFLRQPIPDGLLNKLIYALPLPSPFPSRLRRTFLLRRLDSDLSAGISPSTDTRHFLKLLLDGALGASPSCYESLAAAYRAVTLHCVAVSAADGGPSFRTLLHELCTGVADLEVARPALPTLRKLLSELRVLLAAASESDAATPVPEDDTRAAALDAVRACLTASFKDLGPCFIEQAAEIVIKNRIILGEPPGSGRAFDDDDLGSSKRNVSSLLLQKDMENEVIPNAKFGLLKVAEDDPLVDATKLADEVSTRPAVGNDGVPKQSIMDRNPTAHTFEWGDDMIESSSETSSASSKPICSTDLHTRNASPLPPMEVKKGRRRERKMWTVEEEDSLRAAVQKYGKGNWKLILRTHLDVFEGRKEADLKDKWRNMIRH